MELCLRHGQFAQTDNRTGKAGSRPSLFKALSARYGVQPEYLAAIWGMETSYGAFIGNFDAPSTLASMATEGRRRSFAETELLALMEILDGAMPNENG